MLWQRLRRPARSLALSGAVEALHKLDVRALHGYSVSPTASSASSRVAKPRWRITFESRSVITHAIGLSEPAPLPLPRTAQPPSTTTWSPTRAQVVGVGLHQLPHLGALLEVVAHARRGRRSRRSPPASR